MADPTYIPPMPPQGSSPRTAPAAPVKAPDIYIGGPANKVQPTQKFGMSRTQSKQAIGNLRRKAEDKPLVSRMSKVI